MNYYIPVSFDIKKFLQDNPTVNIANFKKEKLLYILHLINSIPATNKNLELVDGFVPLNAKILQNKIRNYKQYLDYLIANNVLVTDNQYTIGNKSKGFKFTGQYSGKVIPTEVKDTNKEIKSIASLPVKVKKEYNHLLKWYDKRLYIDNATAMDYLEKDLQKKLVNMSTENGTMLLPNKTPYNQYNYSLMNINRIAEAL